MNKLKKDELPKKRGLTVDEIISKYPMTVRILLVQLVEQIDRLQKKPEIRIRPRFSKRTEVTQEFVEKWALLFVGIKSFKIFEESREAAKEIILKMLREAGVEVVGK